MGQDQILGRKNVNICVYANYIHSRCAAHHPFNTDQSIVNLMASTLFDVIIAILIHVAGELILFIFFSDRNHVKLTV